MKLEHHVNRPKHSWRMLKTPFAAQTASELGHCPIPARSQFLLKKIGRS